MMNNEYELVRAVKKALNDVTLSAVKRCFLKLQDVLRKVKDAAGGNSYKLGHTKTRRNDSDDDSDDNLSDNERSNDNGDDKRSEKPRALCNPK